jgi:low temperature requirement protein LtrA
VMSIAIPTGFTTSRGWAIAGAYVAMQVGRSIFVVLVLREDPSLRRNYQRILCWCIASGAVALVGAAVGGHAREVLWAAVVVIDVLGGITGFATPVLGRSSTTDWTIDGGHIAERCHAFMLIALGESVVVLGATLSGLDHIGASEIAVFVFGFAGDVGLWWIYFARSAESAAEVITTSSDPGRYGRAYHEVHPIMIGGIIVIAAAVDLVLKHPLQARPATTWTVLGGSALFIGGHAIFKAYLWRVRPWSRIAAVLILIALLPVAPHLPPMALAGCALAVTIGVCVSDALFVPAGEPDEPAR